MSFKWDGKKSVSRKESCSAELGREGLLKIRQLCTFHWCGVLKLLATDICDWDEAYDGKRCVRLDFSDTGREGWCRQLVGRPFFVQHTPVCLNHEKLGKWRMQVHILRFGMVFIMMLSQRCRDMADRWIGEYKMNWQHSPSNTPLSIIQPRNILKLPGTAVPNYQNLPTGREASSPWLRHGWWILPYPFFR